MNIRKNTAIKHAALTVTIFISLLLIFLRFKNPDITEARFFLDYWFFILWDAVFALIAFMSSEYGYE